MGEEEGGRGQDILDETSRFCTPETPLNPAAKPAGDSPALCPRTFPSSLTHTLRRTDRPPRPLFCSATFWMVGSSGRTLPVRR